MPNMKSIFSFIKFDPKPLRHNRGFNGYPCFCCGRDVMAKEGAPHCYVLGHGDGGTALSVADFNALCEKHGAKDIDELIAACEGTEFRCEAFGSTCFAKVMKAAKDAVIIRNKAGEKFALLY